MGTTYMMMVLGKKNRLYIQSIYNCPLISLWPPLSRQSGEVVFTFFPFLFFLNGQVMLIGITDDTYK